MYGCKVSSRNLGKENGLNNFENSISKFGSRTELGEVRGKLCTDELHNLHFSPGIIRMIKSWLIEWVVHIARTRGIRKS